MTMRYFRATCVALLVLSAACKSGTSGQSSKASSSASAKKKKKAAAQSDSGASTVSEGDAATGAAGGQHLDAGKSPSGGAGGAGSEPPDAHVDASSLDAGSHPGMDAGAGSGSDAATSMDAGQPPGPDAASDSGLAHIGSCCAAHTTPGCSNADLEVCVCSKLVSCCSDSWSAACAMIVKQKYCQPGVHECLCAPDAGDFVQTSCCMDWSDTFCNSVAGSQCGALPGCI